MQIIAHTPEGVFYSRIENDVTEDDVKQVEKTLELVAEGMASYFKLESEDGVFVIGKELLTKSVFMLRKNTNEE